MSVRKIFLVGVLLALLGLGACDQDDSAADLSDSPADMPEEAVVVDEPASAVEAFYTAAVNDDCHAAAVLRPGFTLERCQKLTEAMVHHVESLMQEDKFALVALNITLVSGGKSQDFNGVVHLEKQDGQWVLLKFEEDAAMSSGMPEESGEQEEPLLPDEPDKAQQS